MMTSTTINQFDVSDGGAAACRISAADQVVWLGVNLQHASRHSICGWIFVATARTPDDVTSSASTITLRQLSRLLLLSEADPENELGGGQFRGSGLTEVPQRGPGAEPR